MILSISNQFATLGRNFLESRPSIDDSLAPVAKKKAKNGTTKKAQKEAPVKEVKPSKQIKGGKKDPELELLEIKRKAVIVKNKWVSKLEELDQDVSIALSRAVPFPEDCTEFLGCIERSRHRDGSKIHGLPLP